MDQVGSCLSPPGSLKSVTICPLSSQPATLCCHYHLFSIILTADYRSFKDYRSFWREWGSLRKKLNVGLIHHLYEYLDIKFNKTIYSLQPQEAIPTQDLRRQGERGQGKR